MLRRLLLVFTDKELRNKFFSIILLLIAARLLAHIPIPVLRSQDISTIIDSDAVFGLLNTISGGAYGRLSFVMLGVGPYITASIVMQLLGVIVPKIQEIQKEEGEQGRNKINRWTRWLTIPLAALNGWGILQFLASGNTGGVSIELPEVLRSPDFAVSFPYWSIVILSLVAGSLAMMWIGEIITEIKMGNGISLLILSGITVRLPSQLSKFWNESLPNFQLLFEKFNFNKVLNWEVWKALIWDNPTWTGVRSFSIFLFTLVFTLLLVVFINDAVRKLVIVYSRRGHTEGKSRTLSQVKADLPIKVNIAGVLPIIFAVSFILFPTILGRFFVTSNLATLRDGARTVETYLSTEDNQGIIRPENLPKNEFLGFFATKDKDRLQTVVNYDTTIGQELFGFTISTVEGTKTSLFEGTPLNDLKVPFTNTDMFKYEANTFGFLPTFALRWNGVLAYTFFYFILIIFFTYFYTSQIAFKTDDISENLQKSGAYLPGYKPGIETQNYLTYVSNRLNVAGSIFLAIIAIVPFVFNRYIQFGDGTLTGIVGGTTLLILVSTTVETLKQIEAQATVVDYDRFVK